MRVKVDRQRYFAWQAETSSKIVAEYEERYCSISKILDAVPAVLDLVDRDLKRLSKPGQRGRKSTFTSEILLRTLIVHQLEGFSLRRTQIAIAHSQFLQGFLRLGPRKAPDFSTIERALKRIRPETWEKVNAVITGHAHELELLDTSTLRVDTTVVETTIHYPTDSSLLWDSWRTCYRLLSLARGHFPGLIQHRFHRNKTKKLHLYITRYSKSPSKKRQRSVKKRKRKFLAQVARAVSAVASFVEEHADSDDPTLDAIASEMREFLPPMQTVLRTAERAWLTEEKVPAKDRVFSIFEPHTELIKRGRNGKPVEFGHMILLGQTRDKFITQFSVMRKKIPDNLLPQGIVDKHEQSFGKPPDILVADKGFRGKPEPMEALAERVDQVAIPRVLKDWTDPEFVQLHHFRAGIEGSISVLKRAFGLLRCQYRGFRSFASHVGAAVVCHNLLLLGKLIF